jgi:RES domain-containing protein|tara:strand:- start:544 stop:1074 length:531 start_codon:yes stop_codon:yes gene_type:complete
VDDLVSEFDAEVYRFVQPKYTSVADMFAGKGPLYANGRWLAKGTQLAIYTALAPEVALAEALAATRYYGFPDSRAAPLVFVTAQAKLKKVIDLRNGSIRQRLRLSNSTITELDWRSENTKGQESITQAFGWALQTAGVEGFLCPSSALSGGANLIVFPQNLKQPTALRVLSEVKWS